MNFFSSKTLQKTISVLMLIVVCWMVVPVGVGAAEPREATLGPRGGAGGAQGDTTKLGSWADYFSNPRNTLLLPLKAIPPTAPLAIAADSVVKRLSESTDTGDFCNLGSLTQNVVTGLFFSKIVTCVSYGMLSLSGWFLWASAIIFNFLIDYTLNMPAFVEKFNIVDIGWGAFRDISLVFFVFIILFIAINMIIGKEQYGSKKLLAQVIVAAVLINFSLFFTKVMVDTSNILALQFYSKIVTTSKESLKAGGNQKNLSDVDSGISAAVAHSMGLDQVWGIQNAKNTTSKLTPEKLGWLNILLVGLFGSVFIMVTAVVFLAGGIMMLVRTLALIFLMILSPFAWLGGILPMTKEVSSKWWSTLSSNLVYAPVYMMLMYVVLSMIVANGENRTVDFLGMFTDTSWNSLAVTGFTFVVLNALMIGCIVVANKAGAVGAGFALGVAKGTAGKMTLGLGGALGRNTIGRVSSNVADRFAGRKFAGTYAGRKLMGALRGTANASFDVRNTAAGKDLGLGKGADKGFSGLQTDKEKELTEYGKSLSGKAKTTFATNQFGGNKPTLKGLVIRSNRITGAKIMSENIEEKVKENKDKLNEFMNRTDVKELRRLNGKKMAGALSSAEDIKYNDLVSSIGGEQLDLIKEDGAEASYNGYALALDENDPLISLNAREQIDKYSKTKQVYKDALKRGGLGKA